MFKPFYKQGLIVIFAVLTVCSINAQNKGMQPGINNLVHTSGYSPSVLGDIPAYTKTGNGTRSLILIPGLGFDQSVFNDFILANKNNFTIYAITIPGMGNTMAPPMPDTSVSYSAQTWTNGLLKGILKLMAKEDIAKPILVGHFTYGTQIALKMAIEYPDSIAGVIILGGQAKFISQQNDKAIDYQLKDMIRGTDYFAKSWFKTKTEAEWDKGNYLPEIYSVSKRIGKNLWKQAAEVPVPVMVRYLCEFTASDVKAQLKEIKCPVLILRAKFTDKILSNPLNNYVKSQFIDTWENVSAINSLIQVKDIQNASSFVWKDQPSLTYSEINLFSKNIKNK